LHRGLPWGENVRTYCLSGRCSGIDHEYFNVADFTVIEARVSRAAM
jgi:hypothetical protein